MKQSKVSVRGQTVIPQEIREQLGIKPNSRLAWSARDGVIVAVPIPEDSVQASIGILKDSGYTFADFMEDRRREREFERQLDEREDRRLAEAVKRTHGR